jgi:hypothetical protein
MNARVVPAGRGARWLGEGWRLFRAAPFAWLTVAFLFYLVLILASRVPAVGASLFSLLTPALWVAFMAVARGAGSGRRESPAAFFGGLAQSARAMLALGLIYLAGNVLAIAATIPFSDGHLARWVFRGEAPEHEALASGELLFELALSMLFYSPVLLAYFFAPVLSAWHRFGAVKALFFSFAACTLNWRAFLAYGAVVGATLGVLIALASLITGLLFAGGRAGLNAAVIVWVPVFATFFCVVVASVYASYRDIFADGEQRA